ncbi:GNAT family N-acetyltransferase [Radiobacillus kanasensis]|uniref:GNAT family N-acetyltransferase n=1 Tax=Radiobacillus kanasensis TaxID=2844358 RepID=UPI001E478981|nr:GNAT family N-acetyltransferase [Radiobacillus kanasensis]UFT98209.1 GNAT family N-acetyltransferase [Radiobacillus kanasensis]
MIIPINPKDVLVAKQIYNIQIPSYQIEAEWLGVTSFPPLNETIESIQASNETFIGYVVEGALAGVMSYEIGEEVSICRVVVHPDHFRKGIGRGLVQHVVEKYPTMRITVQTGSKNVPAIQLYEKLGFKKDEEFEVEKGLWMTSFEWTSKKKQQHPRN